nr:hypothetical protein Q903MT_gene191 [Picea sitchensis]
MGINMSTFPVAVIPRSFFPYRWMWHVLKRKTGHPKVSVLFFLTFLPQVSHSSLQG